MTKTNCPVPLYQRPVEEYKELKQSWFFSWPIHNENNSRLYKYLIISWLHTIPAIQIILTGSIQLKNNIEAQIYTSLLLSFCLPIILIIRQLMGWYHIHKRLISEKIEYEETGWYDGQTWEKPEAWKEKDLLIAKYEVIPIIQLLRESLWKIIYIIIIGILILMIIHIYSR